MVIVGRMGKPVTVLEIGRRVRVQIANPEEYAQGCAESLNGKTGVIEELRRDGKSPVSRDLTRLVAAMWLVRFDTPAKPWSGNQLPVNAFWFEPIDLRSEP
jgi:hypothetical protein